MNSVQQLLSDSKKLVQKLKDCETATDTLIAKSQNLGKTVDTMKEYHEDMEALSLISNQRPRSSLIVTIQRESKQLRQLERENKELRCALEDHQFALELIMSKYRQQITQLVKASDTCSTLPNVSSLPNYQDSNGDLIRKQADKICEMLAVMRKSVEIDENQSQKEKQLLTQLKVENDGLRELLSIARANPLIETKRVHVEKEVQTDPMEVIIDDKSKPSVD